MVLVSERINVLRLREQELIRLIDKTKEDYLLRQYFDERQEILSRIRCLSAERQVSLKELGGFE